MKLSRFAKGCARFDNMPRPNLWRHYFDLYLSRCGNLVEAHVDEATEFANACVSAEGKAEPLPTEDASELASCKAFFRYMTTLLAVCSLGSQSEERNAVDEATDDNETWGKMYSHQRALAAAIAEALTDKSDRPFAHYEGVYFDPKRATLVTKHGSFGLDGSFVPPWEAPATTRESRTANSLNSAFQGLAAERGCKDVRSANYSEDEALSVLAKPDAGVWLVTLTIGSPLDGEVRDDPEHRSVTVRFDNLLLALLKAQHLTTTVLT